jgi:hypothetical protein
VTTTNLNGPGAAAPASFALAAKESRTAEPLDILGQQCLVKLADTDTNGAVAMFYLDARRCRVRRCIAIRARMSGSMCWRVR